MLQDYLLKYYTKELEEILDAKEDNLFYSIQVKYVNFIKRLSISV